MIFILEIILEVCYFLSYPFLYLIWRNSTQLDRLSCKYSNIQEGFYFHAASVGEVNALRPLLVNLRNKFSDKKFVLTTTSANGKKTASGIVTNLEVHLAPLDIYHLRYWQLRTMRPKLILIVETEIWPNLLLCAKQLNIPVIFLNARVSQRSLPKYRFLKPFFRIFENNIRAICTQSVTDSERFKALFNVPIVTAGNLKYAVNLPVYNSGSLRFEWGYNTDDFIIVWGSSRPGEEKLFLAVYKELKKKINKLKIIIAIRHIERIEEVIKQYSEEEYSLHSKHEATRDIHIIDEMGLLVKAYAICDIAIVGGSFFDFGGHNPLEPAFYSKPIIIGQYHQSCLSIVKKLQAQNAIIISNTELLKYDVERLALNVETRIEMGKRAKEILDENSHSLSLHCNEIIKLI